MARLARFVIPGIPHHVTQRGNDRQQTFFSDGNSPLFGTQAARVFRHLAFCATVREPRSFG